ncbi:hypothetical protein Ahy_A06g029357 [Arachis hypogaea]|uniref:Uncharacterized protein n=1 Tax=Arachis hypogaea TaxID=3818 RepID=A0A445CT33_ARAHY|nr:hypothetical protein Ahy_A06g029357 [Arachis hypogaea]
MEMILQDYAKLDSDTIANAIRLLVEADPSIKMKSIIVEVQSRFNYIVRYRKVWLAKHIRSNFLRRFKTLYLHKLVVNIGYSRIEKEYNKNYQRLKERSEAHTRWCDEIGVEKWVLKFDKSHRWGHMMTKRNILVNQFDKCNEIFEVCEIRDDYIYTINLANNFAILVIFRSSDYHVATCLHVVPNSQVYEHDVYKMSEICKVYIDEFVPMGVPHLRNLDMMVRRSSSTEY